MSNIRSRINKEPDISGFINNILIFFLIFVKSLILNLKIKNLEGCCEILYVMGLADRKNRHKKNT